MSRQFFGTDGIRGEVGKYPVTADFMLKLGWAAGRVFASSERETHVLIGKDTRVSGYMFESALEAGLVAAGARVTLLGPMPTPAVAVLTRSQKASAGIVISASHNAYTDNGIKFFDAEGASCQTILNWRSNACCLSPWKLCHRLSWEKLPGWWMRRADMWSSVKIRFPTS
jgi:phosphoglucosamine mutase